MPLGKAAKAYDVKKANLNDHLKKNMKNVGHLSSCYVQWKRI